MTELQRPQVRIKLYDVETEADIERVRAGLQRRDVWRNLDLLGPMDRPGKFRGQFLTGYLRAHLILDADTDEEYGFFLLRCGRLKSAGRVEVDIAIPNPSIRGRGISQVALLELFDRWLLGDLCAELWAWIDLGNSSSVQMVRSLNIPVVNQTRRGISVDGTVDVIELRLRKEEWLRLRPSVLEKLGLLAAKSGEPASIGDPSIRRQDVSSLAASGHGGTLSDET
jgi:hypothetical protein